MIELLIINSLLIWGVYASIQEGMIFEKIGNWIRDKRIVNGSFFEKSHYEKKDNLPGWLKKPLGTCPICMSSIYGTPVYWFAHFTIFNYDYAIIVYICYVFALSGLNYLILQFIPND